MRSKVRKFLAIVAIVGAVAVLVMHFDVSWPISSVNGRWQIKDWYEHADASPEQLANYEDARSQYPRAIEIKPFWRATVDDVRCSWTQHVQAWSLPPGRTGVWTTSVLCSDRSPIMLYVPPSNVRTRARTPLGLYEFYSDMNAVPIEVLFFRPGRGFYYIDYIPASWPGRPSQ